MKILFKGELDEESVVRKFRTTASDGKIVIVTCANAGMGMATTAALADMGATVVMLCRDPKRSMEALHTLSRKSDRKLLSSGGAYRHLSCFQ